MSPLASIVIGGVLMSGIALLGAVTFLLSERVQQKLILPLVAFSAGSLLGSAFFHMLPAAVQADPSGLGVWIWVLAGFSLFFAFEQLLHWHRCHHAQGDPASVLPTLIIAGDALHNLLGGMAVAGAFLVDARLGVATWLAEAAHELPQELGEYGVLLHGGWSRRKALIVNVLSSLPFLAGGLLIWAASLPDRRRLPGSLRGRELPLHRGVGPDSGGEPTPPAGDGGAALRGLRGGCPGAALDPDRAAEAEAEAKN